MKKRVKKKYLNSLKKCKLYTANRIRTLIGFALRNGYGITKDAIRDENIYGFLDTHKRAYVYLDYSLKYVLDGVSDEVKLAAYPMFRIDSMGTSIYSWKRCRKYPARFMKAINYGNGGYFSDIHVYDVARSREIWYHNGNLCYWIEPIYKSKFIQNMDMIEPPTEYNRDIYGMIKILEEFDHIKVKDPYDCADKIIDILLSYYEQHQHDTVDEVAIPEWLSYELVCMENKKRYIEAVPMSFGLGGDNLFAKKSDFNKMMMKGFVDHDYGETKNNDIPTNDGAN